MPRSSSIQSSLAVFLAFLWLLAPLNGYPIIGEPLSKQPTLSSLQLDSWTMTLIQDYVPSTSKPSALIPEGAKKKPAVASTSQLIQEFKSPSSSSVVLSSSAPAVDAKVPFTGSMLEELVMMKNPRGHTHWSHKDTFSWDTTQPGCTGNRQSPVDIQPKSTLLTAYPKLAFNNYENIANMVLTNNGHTALFSLPEGLPKEMTPFITGGGLTERYDFVQFHLHWGNDSSKGSEHQIKSQSFPGEIHLVHYNTKYPSFSEATHHVDGLAILGIFIKIGANDSPSFQSIVEQLNEVIMNGEETTLRKPVPLYDLLPKRTTSFYRYMGSLTTPKCEEVVVWTVFDNAITVSERQLAMFRQLIADDGEPLVDNFRETKPLNGRIITYRSFTGCEISRSWPVTSSPFSEAYKWSKCVMGFAFKSVLSS